MKRSYFYLISTLCLLSACSKPPEPTPKPHIVSVTKPTIQDVPYYLDYPGHVEAYKTVDVQTQIAGELTGMYFEEGTPVKEGQLLFTIDSRPYRAALDKAEAALTQSIASLKYAEETAQRYSILAQEEFVAQLQYDQYLTNVLVDDATVQENKATVEEAKLNLGYCTIYSPMTAVAGKKQIDVGNYVTVAENPSLIVLNQIDPVFTSFYAPDTDLPTIQRYQRMHKDGLITYVYLNHDYDHPYEGRLTLINNQVDESTGSIFLKATLPNGTCELWPGEYVEVKLILSTIKNAVLVPTQAVQVGQNGHFVFIVKQDMTAEMKNVSVGQIQGDHIVITDGLKGGESVVLEGQLNLSTGDKVEVQEPSTLPASTTNDSVASLEDKMLTKRAKMKLKEEKKISSRGVR